MQISFHSLHISTKEKNAAQRRCRVNSLFSRIRGVREINISPLLTHTYNRDSDTDPIGKRMNCMVWLAVLWLFLFEEAGKNRKNTECNRFIDIPAHLTRFDGGQSIYTPPQVKDIYPSSDKPRIA